jgi:hypothetical protein
MSMGHRPGHVRDTFLQAIEAWLCWQRGQPEPMIKHEVGYLPRLISLSQACGLVLKCTDILPGTEVDALLDEGLPLKRRTYAAAARAILADLKENKGRRA